MTTNSKPWILLVTAREGETATLRALLAAEGIECRHAASGGEALRMVRGALPEAVLLDESLPEIPAADICRAVRSDPGAIVGVLLLRSAGCEPGIPSALAECVDDMLALPADAGLVRMRIRNLMQNNRLRRKAREDAARIRELEQTRDELTQLIARDMKAPLMGLADLLEMADRDSVKHFRSEASQYLNEALDATETLEEMVSFLNDVRRMLSGELKPVRTRCDLAAVVRRVADLLAENAAAAGVTLAVEGGPAWLACDERLMERTLRHVLRSAILQCRRGGRVVAAVSETDTVTRIEVQCPACREAPGESEPGAQTAHAGAQATGLGMTFCRLVLESHGGTLAMESMEGRAGWVLNLEGDAVTGGMAGPTVDVEAAAGPDPSLPPVSATPLQRSRRYIGKTPVAAAGEASKPFALQTTRYQFSIAIAIMSAIPLLSFGYLFAQSALEQPIKQESLALILGSSVVLVLLGIVLLFRHVIEVGRLRRYFELMAKGGLPGGGVQATSEDFTAIARALGNVIERADNKVRAIEEEVRSRLQTEQQRVMVETVGAACHHLGQPATVIGVYLDLMKKKEVSPEMQRLISECQLAAADVSGILHRLQGVARYETEPYLAARKPGTHRSDERILKI